VRLTTAGPDFESQLDLARQIMTKRRAVLRELAQ
jgi:hypothetical protein